MISLLERIEGVVFGTAIGDALGYPVEFNKTLLPVRGLDKEQALYSDDTQMFLATVDGLLETEPWLMDLENAAERIAKHYVRWSKSPENNRAPGASCMYGCRNLAEGVAWRAAGRPGARGCGTAMRSMAYGLFLQTDMAAHWAGEHALMTHRDPSAQASAAAVAAGTAALIAGLVNKEAVAAIMVTAAADYDKATALMLNQAIDFARKGVPADVVLNQWRGWDGDEAVAASLYCFLQGINYEMVALLAVNSPGDSDSLGAIAGALAGALYGGHRIPGVWKVNIENSAWLTRYCDKIRQWHVLYSGNR